MIHGIGLFLPSQVPGERPSTAPSSPPSSAPPSSSPPASSWPPLLPLGWSGPPWPRCTWPVLSLRTWIGGGGIDPQLFPEDVQTLVFQSTGKCGQLLPLHKSELVHEDLQNLHPNCPTKVTGSRYLEVLYWFGDIDGVMVMPILIMIVMMTTMTKSLRRFGCVSFLHPSVSQGRVGLVHCAADAAGKDVWSTGSAISK